MGAGEVLEGGEEVVAEGFYGGGGGEGHFGGWGWEIDGGMGHGG